MRDYERRPLRCRHHHRIALDPTPGELEHLLDELERAINEVERQLLRAEQNPTANGGDDHGQETVG